MDERTPSAACGGLRAAPQRRYVLDECYFDQVDTPEKAYWLGFLAGDGNVLDKGEIQIRLMASDADHLRAFAEALQTDSPVRFERYKALGGVRERARFRIASRHMAFSVAMHGVGPRKTLTLQPWLGPPELMRDYWRGLIDADGTIGISPRWQIRLTGTFAITEAFGLWMRTVVPTLQCKPLQSGKVWNIGTTGRLTCQALARALYEGCAIALPRKAARAAECISSGPPVIGTPEWREQMRRAHGTPEYREQARRWALKRWTAARSSRATTAR